jgi:hypothetical protein
MKRMFILAAILISLTIVACGGSGEKSSAPVTDSTSVITDSTTTDSTQVDSVM